MNIVSIVFSILAFVFSAQVAAASGINCAGSDPQSLVFEKYQSFTDEKIIDDCTYDILAAVPGVTAARLKTNNSRTSSCVRSVEKMRDISRNYLGQKKTFCQSVQNAGCAGSNQADCLLKAGKLSAGAQQKHNSLSSLLGRGKAEMQELQRYRRLRSKKYKDDFQVLKSIPASEKAGASHVSNKQLNSQQNSVHGGSQPTAPPVSKSGITAGQGYEPKGGIAPGEIQARDGGVKTLAEYENRLPHLIRESEMNLKRMEEFEKVAGTKQIQHTVAAKEMATRAGDLFFSAEKLGIVDEEMSQWKAANAEVVQQQAQAKMQKPAAAEGEPAPTGDLIASSEKVELKAAAESVEPSVAPAEAKAAGSPEAKIDSVLEAFETKLTATDPEISEVKRARLKELLRLKLLGEKQGEQEADPSFNPGELVNELIAETAELAEREPTSPGKQGEGIGTLDVDSALTDMEEQLRELDRQHGILESESLSLFERVRMILKRAYKAGMVGKK